MGVNCSNCGTDNTKDSAFCKKCGAQLKKPGEKLNRMSGKSKEISKNKQAELRLQQSEAHLRRAQEVASVGSWDLDLVSGNLVWSDEIYRIFGITIGTRVSYERFLDAVLPEDREYVDQSWQAALRGAPYDIEHRISVGDEVKWVREKADLEFDKEGRALRGIGTVQNISKQKEADTALRKSEENYRTLVEQAKDGISIVQEGKIKFVNSYIADLMGYTVEELLNDSFTEHISPDEIPRVTDIYKRRINGENVPTVYESAIQRKDGSRVEVEYNIGLTTYAGKTANLVIVRDITERKLAETALKEHNQLQELITKISTKFLGLSGVEFEQAIQDSLEEVGRYFDVDTVRLYRLSLQGDVVKIRNMWRSESLAPPDEMPEIHKLKYPNLAAHYSQGEPVVFSKYEDSPQWPEMRKILKFFGTKAGVGVPLESDSTGVDIFAMDKVRSEHVWHENIIEHSRAIGKVMLGAMRRRENEIELQDSYNEIKELKDRLKQENIYLQEEIKREHRFEEIIGQSHGLQYILRRVEEIAPTDTTVLILGETGTGKELIARAIHIASPRKERPLLLVNCATLPSNLIESELFGHEKGAFSGAITQRIGRFEIADRATIVLDEIGELPLELQAKLLRVIQNGEFERLGSSKTIKVDARVIAMTNRDLEDEIKNGRFRQDLYYRLNIFPITVLPLRERKDDIPPLVNHFVEKHCRKLGKEIHKISRKAMEDMQNYPWPGNIRELENIIERAVITSKGTELKVDLPLLSAELLEAKKTLEELERDHIINTLERTSWKISGPGGAAEILGIHSNTLRSRMEKLGISKS